MPSHVHVYWLELSGTPDKTLEVLHRARVSQKGPHAALLTTCEFGLLPRVLEYSLLLTFKAFQLQQARARTLDLEWLRLLAGTRSIEQALAFTRPSSNQVMVASSWPLSREVLAALGKPIPPSQSQRQAWQAHLAQAYGFPPEAIRTYSLEDLAIERVVLSLLE